MDLWHRIRTTWEQDGLKVPPGVTSDELNAFKQRYDVMLPPSMREYFQVTNGNSDMGSDFFTFWPLRDVKLVSEELAEPFYTDRLNYPQCFVFADFLLWCWAYAIYLDKDGNTEGPVYLLGNSEHKVAVAATFLEFMEMYDANPEDVAYFHGPEHSTG